MPEKVVSDSSPLISLFLIERFSLLKEFYKRIIIPEAVWKEIIYTKKQGVEFFEQERERNFLLVKTVSHTPFLQLLKKDLDEGEAEAIALALIEKADLLLLDEKDARAIARTYNFRLAGVIGILIKARFENKISSLHQELDLLEKRGFRIHPELYKKALQLCKEK